MKKHSRTSGILAFLLITPTLLFAQAGSVDLSFNPGTGEVGPNTYCIGVQTNGQYIIGGGFGTFNGSDFPGIVRVNPDGSLDSTFGPLQGGGGASAIAIQPDGNVVVAGPFSQINGLPRPQIARLRYDGSVDTSFSPTNSGGEIAVALQANGKILSAGGNIITRYNTDGTEDNSFNVGSGLDSGNISCLGLQSNGQILIGGNFTSFNGVSRNYLVRLNSNGHVDTNFNAELEPTGGLNGLVVLPGDEIFIWGGFVGVNGYLRNHVARLNADGTLDMGFNPGLGADGIVSGGAAESDGKVMIFGGFDTFNGSACPSGFIRLNTNGTFDSSLNVGSGAPYSLNCTICLPNGKVLVGGTFTRFGGVNINGIVRLNGDNSATNTMQFLNANKYFGAYLQGAVSNQYRVEWTTNLNTPALWTPLFNVILQTNPQFIADPSPIGGYPRFYRAVQVAP